MDIVGAVQGEIDQECRNELGDDGGVGHAFHAHAHTHNEGQVQHDVDHRTDDEEVQGPAAVAYRPQDARAHIIEHQAGNAAKIDPQIDLGLHEHILGRFHQLQHGGGQQNAHRRAHQSDDQGQGDGGVDCFVDALGILCAKPLGDDDAGAHRNAREKAHQHIDDGGGGAHRSQCLFADIVAHHDGVHRVVKLLEQIADHQRQSKGDQVLPDLALGHVAGLFARCCHFCFASLSLVN